MDRLPCLIFLLLLGLTSARAGEGEVLFVNGFEGTGNLPQFVAVDDQAVAAKRRLVVDIDTSEPANQAGLAFSLDAAPVGGSIRSGSGQIEWTPSQAQIGRMEVTVRVEDLAGLSNTLTFAIGVVDDSAAPLIEPIADRGAAPGVPVQVACAARCRPGSGA